MAKLTRRAMLWATPAGIATLGGVAALLTTFKTQDKADAASAKTSAPTTGSLTLYVRDVTKSEVSVFMGEQEVVIQDAALVNQLLSKFH
ncbi:MAG: hypothetical protein PVS3B3_34480 [Ktedonobacteraceae bacterium]